MAFAALFISVGHLVVQSADVPNQQALLLVSIDGMQPDYVLKADRYNLKIPRLRRQTESHRSNPVEGGRP